MWFEFTESEWRCMFLTDQHVFGQPALLFSDAGRDSKSEALLSQQWVSTVTAAERHDLPLVGDVSDQGEIRVTRPVIHQRLWEREKLNVSVCKRASSRVRGSHEYLLLRGSGQPTECRHLTNSPFPSAFSTALPTRVMILMLATTYGESVSSTPILESGEPTGPMLNGITYMTRPAAETWTLYFWTSSETSKHTFLYEH